MIWIPNQLVGAPLGTTVKLECHTESSPKAISYWAYNDSMVLTSERFKTEERHHSVYKLDSTLVIKNLRRQDFGSYRCISKNSLGETDGAIMLYELETPTKETKVTTVTYVPGKRWNLVTWSRLLGFLICFIFRVWVFLRLQHAYLQSWSAIQCCHTNQ